MFRTAAALMFTLALSSLPARAADNENAAPATGGGSSAVVAADLDLSRLPAVNRPDVTTRRIRRPGALPLLHAGFAGLQAYDFYSTRRALAQGGQEANPVMKGIVGNPFAFAAVKGVMTVAPMMIANRMWRTNRVGAIMTMVVANGAMAAVAANNARVLRRQR